MPSVEIISYGHLHGEPPQAHLTVDLREHFRDPHFDPALRQLTARDKRVRDAVMDTPGIADLVAALAMSVRAYLAGPSQADLTVAIGCGGGRHRAAQTAAALADTLIAQRIPVRLHHRDIDRPVVER